MFFYVVIKPFLEKIMFVSENNMLIMQLSNTIILTIYMNSYLLLF